MKNARGNVKLDVLDYADDQDSDVMTAVAHNMGFDGTGVKDLYRK